jgi:hypothetical protein
LAAAVVSHAGLAADPFGLMAIEGQERYSLLVGREVEIQNLLELEHQFKLSGIPAQGEFYAFGLGLKPAGWPGYFRSELSVDFFGDGVGRDHVIAFLLEPIYFKPPNARLGASGYYQKGVTLATGHRALSGRFGRMLSTQTWTLCRRCRRRSLCNKKRAVSRRVARSPRWRAACHKIRAVSRRQVCPRQKKSAIQRRVPKKSKGQLPATRSFSRGKNRGPFQRRFFGTSFTIHHYGLLARLSVSA